MPTESTLSRLWQLALVLTAYNRLASTETLLALDRPIGQYINYALLGGQQTTSKRPPP